MAKHTSKSSPREWVSPCGRYRLLQGDCLELLPTVSGVDCVLTDPPYGVTDCLWDQAPPLDRLGAALAAAAKEEANWCVFATQPFATDVIVAWRKWFRYELVWRKNRPVGFLNANRQPLRQHELILLFGRAKGKALYQPQMTEGKPYKSNGKSSSTVYREHGDRPPKINTGTRHPTSVLAIDDAGRGKLHPTQKPVSLCRWLLRTYSKPDDLVCDPYSGSATTGEAWIAEGRRFVGFERDREIFQHAVARLAAAAAQVTPEAKAA